MFNNGYEIKNYQSKKTFSSFLNGIAGLKGVPIWSFYINRGQAITSFGTRDKNGAIMEFFPANAAYMYTKQIGFRTLIKVGSKYYEFFKAANDKQVMRISREKLVIEELNEELKISLKITYYILPNEKNGALVRKVEVTNLGEHREIELIDGLAQILSAGIDYGGYKAISNLLQSWMQVEELDNALFYKLRGTTEDTSEVGEVKDGNFYLTYMKDNIPFEYIYDNKIIFDYDTSLDDPINFKNTKITSLTKEKQASVNQVPSAYTAIETVLEEKLEFISLIGYASDKAYLKFASDKYDYQYLSDKETESKIIHENLVSVIDTETNFPIYDEYMKQNYLDNVLRGGVPIMYQTKDEFVGYHVYSRKHGDLERDYNFFSLEPNYYSQGNGNFRDVLQNRRNDLMFNPELKDSNLYQFASLIQADGYNPLSIEGLKFKYSGESVYSETIMNLIVKEFTPGELSRALEKEDLDIESNLQKILSDSKVVIKATFGEGYWADHFTYIDDVIASVENIYPDELENIMFKNKKYAFYNSGVFVKPRKDKYVLIDEGKVRQYNSIEHLEKKFDWLIDANGNTIKVNLIGKLVTLILNKYAILDPFNIGISYEANKPGWNDAMNGLPGIFASGVSETIEALKLTRRVLKYLREFKDSKVYLLKETKKLFDGLNKIDYEDNLNFWNKRMDEIEKYRIKIKDNIMDTVEIQSENLINMIEKIESVFVNGIEKAKQISNIIPTYLSYEVEKYETIKDNFVKVLKFNLKPIPTFLEGPTRYLKLSNNTSDARKIYNLIKTSELYDKNFKFYKTSVDLTNENAEIGRIYAFTKGWLERESNFLHMTYKYLFSLLTAGLYEEFYEEIKTNYTCFMDPDVYGRPPIENSSFIAPSNNPDERKHGQGFVSRLSGSTAEMLSMWSYMFFGPKLFSYENDLLSFELNPKLSKDFFKEGKVKTTIFGSIKVEIINEDLLNTYIEENTSRKLILIDNDDNQIEVNGNKVFGEWALKIRQKSIYKIILIISKEEKE